MPKQRMAGYTPLKGRAHDDATPLTQEAAPQPVAEAGPEETVAPATAAPAAVAGRAVAGGAAAGAAAGGALSGDADGVQQAAPGEPVDGAAEQVAQPGAEQPAAEPAAAAAAPAAVPAARDAVPYEQRQRMAGYTPFQGAAPQVVTGGAPAQASAAPAEEPAQGAAVAADQSAPSLEDGQGAGVGVGAAAVGGAAAGSAVVAGISSTDQGDDEQPQSAVASSDGADAAPAAAAPAPAPVAGVPYEQRQRMAGYTPLKGGVPAASSPAAAQSPAAEPVSSGQQPAGAHSAEAQQADAQGTGAAAAGAVAGGAVAAGAAGAAAQDSSAADATQAEQPAAASAEGGQTDAAAQAQAPAAPVGQRMKGYTPLKGRAAGAPAPASAAPAQAAPAAADQPAQAQAAAPAQQAAATDQTPAAGVEAQAATAGQKQRMGAGTAAAGGVAAAGAAGAAAAHASGQKADAQDGAPKHAAQPASGQQAASQKTPAQKRTAAKPAAGQKAAGKPAAQPKKKAKDAEPMPLGRKVLWGVLGAVVVGLALVLAARGLRTLEPVQDFIAQYDGHTAQPESAPIGIPAWLGWQHFLNMFLMVLIIRTGLQIRSEQRPPANFTPRKDSLFSAKGNTPKKYSMTIWMHQALDGLWVLNGLVFVILLFVTGQWMRIVPTDPYVFHHALSAGIQYMSLDWPSENGWIHYNALQMIAYTLVVFVAAPLAALTGWRMSSWFPTEAKGLNKAFQMEAARKVHFPVMLFFVAFILVHVFLVVFTGFLANLNHMYTSREATDFWGLVVFLVSVAVTAAAWFFLRPQFVAPVAQRFGTVGR